jgi:flagellar biogenesis protein FliO
MYRLLLWSMMFWPISLCALAQEVGTQQPPHRLQPDQLKGRPIEQANAQASLSFGDPRVFQRSAQQENSLRTMPVQASAETPVAPDATARGVADLNTEQSVAPPGSRVSENRGAANAPLPIARKSDATSAGNAETSPIAPREEKDGTTNIDSLITVAGSLGIVLGLFLVTMWCFRRGMPKSARSLPPEVVEVLGRAPLAGRQQMHLIRFGNKLVLAAVSPSGVDTISEITDPIEANRLAGYCEQTRSTSATASFRGILDRLDERGSYDAPEEYPRRPKRDLASVVGLKGSHAEDDYV